jgi:hypothetical protein
MSLTLNEQTNAELAEFCQNEGFTTKTNAIIHCIKLALKLHQNGAHMMQSPIRTHDVTSSHNNNNIYYGNRVPNSDFSNSSKNFDSKKTTPATTLPDNWSPPDHLSWKYCERYGLNYPEALKLFKSMMLEKGEKSRNWDQTWNIKVMKGVLKSVQLEDDSLQPQDTMAHRLGRSD